MHGNFFPVNVVHFGGKKATASLKKAFYRKSTRNPMSSTKISSICMLALFFTRAHAVGTTPNYVYSTRKCVNFFMSSTRAAMNTFDEDFV